MADKAKHAFGSSANIQSALAAGKIDEFDILFLDGDTDEPKVGWVDKNGKVVIAYGEDEDEVIVVDSLPETGIAGSIYVFGEEAYIWNGEKFVNLCKPTDVGELKDQLAALEEKDIAIEAEIAAKANAEDVAASVKQAKTDAIAESNAYADKKAESAIDVCIPEKFEITNVPVGTLVDYRDKEIRVMVPANAQWVKQSVGSTGNANMYYMGFKAYAPEGAVSFKEGDRGVIVDKMFTFDDDFAGTDEYGRNYSICWLALASYDATSDAWSYFGKGSSTEKYIGWDYVVEWYNADGIVIAYNHVRINLSNEDCHYSTEPYYMVKMMQTIEEKIDAKIEEISEIPVVEF